MLMLHRAAGAPRRRVRLTSNVRLRKNMNSEDITLRQSQHGDEVALAELRVNAMRESLEAVGRFDPIRARTRFLESFVPAETHHIIVNEEAVGFLVVRAQGATLLLDHLYLHPIHQGKGIGAAILNILQKQAAEQGRSIHVGALKESRSNQFYQRHGFKPVTDGEWDRYYVWHDTSAA
jgi:GNAT superfamily N-acetyltransferase